MIRYRHLVWAFTFMLAASASAQIMHDTTGAPSIGLDSMEVVTTGVVAVQSNLPEGIVYRGAARLGVVNESPFELAPGRYMLTLMEPNGEAWQRRHAEAEVEVRAGEMTVLRLDVPYRYRVESFPYGATVRLGAGEDAPILGETPLTYESAQPLGDDLVVTLPGHRSARQPAGAETDNNYSFVLRPLDVDDERAAEIGWDEARSPNAWIDAAAVGLALSAGALSVYYKFKGDDLYDAYLVTGDETLRPDFERYDTYSAVALGAMQIGIGVFAIRLVLR